LLQFYFISGLIHLTATKCTYFYKKNHIVREAVGIKAASRRPSYHWTSNN